MTNEMLIDTVRETLQLMLVVSAPILFAALLVGLVVSIIQAVTQIQEQTLSFVPKIIAMGVVAIVTMPWVAQMLIEFSERMFGGY